MQTFYGYYDSPIGLVEIGATSEEVISLFFVEKRRFEKRRAHGHAFQPPRGGLDILETGGVIRLRFTCIG